MNTQDTFNANSLSGTISTFTKENIRNNFKRPIATGFLQLDKILGGGLTTGVTVLGATSGLGKSTLLLQIAENISNNDIPVLYFSFEMPRIMIAAKAISRQMFFDTNLDKKFSISATELVFTKQTSSVWKQIDKSRARVEKKSRNLVIEDSSHSGEGIYRHVSNFISEAKEHPVVIVDYLQIIQPDEHKLMGSDKQIVEHNFRWMTKLAKDYKIPVILISSLNRMSYDQKVRLDSFKETGGIEYSADVVLGLSFTAAPEFLSKNHTFSLSAEKAKSPRLVELTALKQRYGSSGADSTVQMDYFAEFDYFRERKPDAKKSPNRKSGTAGRNIIQPDEDDINDAPMDTVQ